MSEASGYEEFHYFECNICKRHEYTKKRMEIHVKECKALNNINQKIRNQNKNFVMVSQRNDS